MPAISLKLKGNGVINKAFVEMLDALGYDIQLTYVKKKEAESMAYESPLTIAEVVKDISANQYVLPSIQREFVWSIAQIERLFDSVIQDYCFIFWRYKR